MTSLCIRIVVVAVGIFVTQSVLCADSSPSPAFSATNGAPVVTGSATGNTRDAPPGVQAGTAGVLSGSSRAFSPPEPTVLIDSEKATVYKLPSFFTYTFGCLTALMSIVTLVLGSLVVVNVLTGARELKEAKSEIKKLKESREEFEGHILECKKAYSTFLEGLSQQVKSEAQKAITDTIQQQYATVIIQDKKQKLLEELAEDNPKPESIFPQLTDILNYPDATSLKIYQLCIVKCQGNGDIMRKVADGLAKCNAIQAVNASSASLPS